MSARASSGGRRPSPRAARSAPPPERARALRRYAPALVLCAVAFVVGAVIGARHMSPGQRHVERFAAAWERADYAAMYAELGDGDRARLGRARFSRAYQDAMDTATAQRVQAGRPRRDGDVYRVPMRIATRIFGTVAGEVVVPATDAGVQWSPQLVFPGLGPGERLSRATRMPPRATLLARDRTVLAEGDDRSSPSPVAGQVVGELGPIPPERRDELARMGVPSDALVGVTGLERIFDTRLVGRPGGELLAGTRVIGRSAPRQAPAVRTTISLPVEEAAATALAGRLGGVVVLQPRTGEVLAFAGIAFSGLQPPGSTFKIVTAAAALAAGITSPSKAYPVQTKTTIEGVDLENANGESCGGTLTMSFAHSCNSVFAPLGAQLGAKRLVRTAEAFGFNRPPDIAGAAQSTIPPADEIGDALAVGSSAIGQGRVQATALQMATVAATIGRGGRRPRFTLDYAAARRGPLRTTRATSPRVARTVERLMLAVVQGGTGVSAAIAGVPVAGKTGTAELRTTKRCQPDPLDPSACPPEQQRNDPTDTDAWFAAYAPAGRGTPRVAVGILLVASGAGADTAAPAARQVMVAALKATAGR